MKQYKKQKISQKSSTKNYTSEAKYQENPELKLVYEKCRYQANPENEIKY